MEPMSAEEFHGADRYEAMEFSLPFGSTMIVFVPEGSLPPAKVILDMVAPVNLLPSKYPKRTYPDGNEWIVPDQISIAAIAVLPSLTREVLLTSYPGASPASRAHLANQVHAHCAAEFADFEESRMDALRGLPTLGVGAGATAVQIGNALAAQDVLDAAFGSRSYTRRRFKFLGAALYHYEHGADADSARANALDARMRAVATLPETDYLAVAPRERDRAMAYVLVQALSHLGGISTLGLTVRAEAIDPTTAFAATQLANPGRYARAALMLETLNPEVLRPVLGNWRP